MENLCEEHFFSFLGLHDKKDLYLGDLQITVPHTPCTSYPLTNMACCSRKNKMSEKKI